MVLFLFSSFELRLYQLIHLLFRLEDRQHVRGFLIADSQHLTIYCLLLHGDSHCFDKVGLFLLLFGGKRCLNCKIEVVDVTIHQVTQIFEVIV